jgi:hypothetical protein
MQQESPCCVVDRAGGVWGTPPAARAAPLRYDGGVACSLGDARDPSVSSLPVRTYPRLSTALGDVTLRSPHDICRRARSHLKRLSPSPSRSSRTIEMPVEQLQLPMNG